MEKNPIVTIIIATLNSEKLLPQALKTIKEQKFPQHKIEILVVDGGSTDSTMIIAKKSKCRVIPNPKVAPAFAKHIGFLEAKGKYILYLDSDEVMKNKNSIAAKLKAFEENPSVKTVISTGYKKPNSYPFICNYINEFGDPFSFFIYRISKDSRFFLSDMVKKYLVKKNTKDYTIFDLTKTSVLPIIELVAMATMIDGEYFKKHFPQLKKNEALIPHLFYLMNHDRKMIAIMHDDSIEHYSADSFGKYLNKIRSRIKNNIYNTSSNAVEGYTGREQYLPPVARMKKFLFIPYAFTFLFLFIDAMWLSTTRKDVRYLIHIPLTLFTAWLIVYHLLLKSMGFHQTLKSYGEAKTIKN